MPKKPCEKQDFPITTCKTKIYKRCPGWKGPKPRKPSDPNKPSKKRSKRSFEKFYDREYKPLPVQAKSHSEKSGKWKWQRIDKDGRKGPIEYTRFPPTNLKKFPHLFHVIEEGTENI